MSEQEQEQDTAKVRDEWVKEYVALRDKLRDKQAQDIAAAVTLRVGLGASRELTISTYLPRDADVGEYHNVLDKLGAAADRQDAKGRIDDLHRELAQATKLSKQAKEDFDRIDIKNHNDWAAMHKKGEPRLSQQESDRKRDVLVTIGRYDDEIKRLEGEIAKTEEIVHGRPTGPRLVAGGQGTGF